MDNIKRFIVSGGIGALTHFCILIFFKEVVGTTIVVSTTFAFVIASGVSFLLQKFWTFKNHGLETVHKQAASYLAVALWNVGMNALLMHLFTQKLMLYYLLAQVITSLFIAIESYFLYKHFVFASNKNVIPN